MHDCGYPAIRPLSAGLEYRIAFLRFLWLFAKVFSAKFGGVAPLVLQNEQSANVFSTKIVFFTNSRKFSLSKVSRYTVFTLIQASYFPKHLLVSMHVGPEVSPGWQACCPNPSRPGSPSKESSGLWVYIFGCLTGPRMLCVWCNEWLIVLLLICIHIFSYAVQYFHQL